MMLSIRAFAAVVSAGSFTAAARNLKVHPPQVSRAIAELEAHLRLRLLSRTTRRVTLTAAGERYLVHCQSILACLDLAEAEVAAMCGSPSGTLRIGVAPSFDRRHLIPHISRYQQQYPQVSVDVTLVHGASETSLEFHDVVLLCDPGSERATLAWDFLGATSLVLCASPAYLANNGVPGEVNDLQGHACVLSTTGIASRQWMFNDRKGSEVFVPHRISLRSDQVDMLAAAILDGVGIGPLPVTKALRSLRSGSLVHVLPGCRLGVQNLYAVYKSVQYKDPKIQAWIAILKTSLPGLLASDETGFASLPKGLIVSPRVRVSGQRGSDI